MPLSSRSLLSTALWSPFTLLLPGPFSLSSSTSNKSKWASAWSSSRPNSSSKRLSRAWLLNIIEALMDVTCWRWDNNFSDRFLVVIRLLSNVEIRRIKATTSDSPLDAWRLRNSFSRWWDTYSKSFTTRLNSISRPPTASSISLFLVDLFCGFDQLTVKPTLRSLLMTEGSSGAQLTSKEWSKKRGRIVIFSSSFFGVVFLQPTAIFWQDQKWLTGIIDYIILLIYIIVIIKVSNQ